MCTKPTTYVGVEITVVFASEAYEIVVLSIQTMISTRGMFTCLGCVERAICNNLMSHFKCNILHLLKC